MHLNLGMKIRELRRRDSRTQEALADALGVTPQAVSRWEQGRQLPRYGTAARHRQLFRRNH
ncbi:MAG: helix-turn-helix transcriptional regulator [Clostridia bacterium]|nr:helix-turn-helix transcriptional regulator [Clostridia bacterium]